MSQTVSLKRATKELADAHHLNWLDFYEATFRQLNRFGMAYELVQLPDDILAPDDAMFELVLSEVLEQLRPSE